MLTAPGIDPGRRFFCEAETAGGHDKRNGAAYISVMRILAVVSLFAVLALAGWFAVSAFVHFGGEPIPVYGYVAIAGGVILSLLVGGGLMALVFYSSRHGYDDGASNP